MYVLFLSVVYGVAMKSILKGAGAFLFVNYMSMLFSFAVIMVNGKILTPQDFGLISLAMVLVNVAESLKQTGFKEYLIAKDGVSRDDEDSSWTLELAKNSILAFLLFVSKDAVVLYFEEPRLSAIVNVFVLLFLFESFVSPHFYKFRKNLDYKKMVLYNFLTNTLYTVAAIFLVYKYMNYYGVVLSYMVKTLSEVVLSYAFYPKKVRFYVDLSLVRAQMSFGKWIVLSAIVFYFTNRFDNFVLANAVSLEDLGYYVFAFSVANAVIGQPIKSVNTALFPLLAKKFDSYSPRRILVLISLAGLSLCGLLLLFLPYVITEFIDKKWERSIEVVSILVVAMYVNGLRVDGFFLAKGKPKYKFIIDLAKGVSFVPLLILLVESYGVIGAAYANLISSALAFVVWFYYIEFKINKMARVL